MTTNVVSPYDSSILKGLAIVAVITIHTLSSLENIYTLTNPALYLAVSLDQMARFSVPLFVALSGYGFWQKYDGQSPSLGSFLLRQTSKLIPLYFIASLISYLTFYFIPAWRDPTVTQSFITQFLTGKADYHLYFVPMIFQLYLLFPILRHFVRKYRWTSLVLVGLLQIGIYHYLASSSLLSDQQTYTWFFTWIFYFILGMHLSDISSWLIAKLPRIMALISATVMSWAWASNLSFSSIQSGIDPIFATSFTRIETLSYASCAVITCFVLASLRTRHTRLTRLLSKIGDISYPLYLFHALALRLLLG